LKFFWHNGRALLVNNNVLMKKYLLSTTSLILLLFWPIQAQEIPVPFEPQTVTSERFNTISETTYLTTLALRGFNLDTQGVLIESLDGSMVYADHHSDVAFNPASVIKIATSLAALEQFGPDYEFETAFFTDGSINKKTRTLQGNLILSATGDPLLTSTDVTRLLRQVIRAGVVRVSGNLIVSGPFSFGGYYTTDRAVKRLAVVARSLGIAVKGQVKRAANVGGVRVAAQRDLRPRDADAFQHIHVPARLYLHLDALVSGRQLDLYLVKELVDGILDADGYAAIDLAPLTAEQFPQRDLADARFGVP